MLPCSHVLVLKAVEVLISYYLRWLEEESGRP